MSEQSYRGRRPWVEGSGAGEGASKSGSLRPSCRTLGGEYTAAAEVWYAERSLRLAAIAARVRKHLGKE